MNETTVRNGRTVKRVIVGLPSITAVPLSAIAIKNKPSVVRYKALAFHEDRKNASFLAVNNFVIETKGSIKPDWDPNIPPNGGWRCPPGTTYGGRYTDKFGRDCMGGVLRRLGRTFGQIGDGMQLRGRLHDERALARRAARQAYRDERARINREFPSLGRRAARRLGQAMRRETNDIEFGMFGVPVGRQRRGAKPQRPGIVTRALDRMGEGFNRLIDRAIYGRQTKRKKGKRVVTSQKISTRKRRSRTAKRPPILTRLADRAGDAYNRFLDRVIYGRQGGRRRRRGIPGQAGTVTKIPPKPKTPRAKKAKAVVQKAKPAPISPAKKKIKSVGLISFDDLTGKQLDDLFTEAISEFDQLEAFWRKRLGVKDGDPIPDNFDDLIDAYIEERVAKGAKGAYIGYLKAQRNDYKALRDFKDAQKNGDKNAMLAALNKVGPTRRQKLIDTYSAPTPAPKPVAPKVPKPKPAKPKPKPVPEPVEPDIPSVDVPEEIPDIAPEPTPDEVDLPDFLKPEPVPEEVVPDQTIEPDVQIDETPEPVIPDNEEIDLPDFLKPEPTAEEVVPEVQTPVAEEQLTPPVPQTPPEEDLTPEIEDTNVEETVVSQQAEAQQPTELDLSGFNITDGIFTDKEFDKTAEDIENAIQYAKELSSQLPEGTKVGLITNNNGKYSVQLVAQQTPGTFPPFQNIVVFENGNVLGAVSYEDYVKLGIAEANKDIDPEDLIDWGPGTLTVTPLMAKGLDHAATLPLWTDARAISKVQKADTLIIAVIPEGGKKARIYVGTQQQLVEQLKKDEGELGNEPKFFALGYHHFKSDRPVVFHNEYHAKFAQTYNGSKPLTQDDLVLDGANWMSGPGGSTTGGINQSLTVIFDGLNERVSALGDDKDFKNTYHNVYINSIHDTFKPVGVDYNYVDKVRFTAYRNWQGFLNQNTPSGTDEWSLDPKRRLKIMRRSPSSAASSGYRIIEPVTKNHYGTNGETSIYKDSDFGTQLNKFDVLPKNFWDLAVQSAKQTSGYDDSYLIYDPTSTTPWKIVDQKRFDFLRDQKLLAAKHVVVHFHKNYAGVKYVSYNKHAFTTSDPSPDIVYVSQSDIDDLDTFSSILSAAFPSFNFPVDQADLSTITIDTTYIPGQSAKPLAPPMQLSNAIAAINAVKETIDAGETSTSEAIYKASEVVATSQIFAKFKGQIPSDEELQKLLNEAQEQFDSAIAQMKETGAGFSETEPSHITALAARAKLDLIKKLQASSEKQKLIALNSTEMHEAMGKLPQGIPLALPEEVINYSTNKPSFKSNVADKWAEFIDQFPIEDVVSLTLQQALQSVGQDPVDTLVGLIWYLKEKYPTDGDKQWPLTPNIIDSITSAIAATKIDHNAHLNTMTLEVLADWMKKFNKLKGESGDLKYFTVDKLKSKLTEIIGVFLDDEIIKHIGGRLAYYESLNPADTQFADIQEFYLFVSDLAASIKNYFGTGVPGMVSKAHLDDQIAKHGSITNAIKNKLDEILNRGHFPLSETGKEDKYQLMLVAMLEAFDDYGTNLEAAYSHMKNVESTVQMLDPYLYKPAPTPVPTKDDLIVILSGDGVIEEAALGKKFNDTIGLMHEMAMGQNETLVLYFNNGTLKVAPYATFADEVDVNGLNSVVAAVTPNGSIYIASPNEADNPNSKWHSKLGKYGTGGFKAPLGAKYVFEAEDPYENLDAAMKLLELNDKHMVYGSNGKSKFWHWGTKPSVVTPMDLPSTASLGSVKYSIISTSDKIDDILQNPDTPVMSIDDVVNILNPVGLSQLMTDIKQSNPSLKQGAKLVAVLDKKDGEDVIKFIIHDSYESVSAAAEAYTGKRIIFTLDLKTAYVHQYLSYPNGYAYATPLAGGSLEYWLNNYFEGSPINEKLETGFDWWKSNYKATKNIKELIADLVGTQNYIDKEKAKKSFSKNLDELFLDLIQSPDADPDNPIFKPGKDLFDLEELGKLDSLANTIGDNTLPLVADGKIDASNEYEKARKAVSDKSSIILPYISQLFEQLDAAGVDYADGVILPGDDEYDNALDTFTSIIGAGSPIVDLLEKARKILDGLSDGEGPGTPEDKFGLEAFVTALSNGIDKPDDLRHVAHWLYASILALHAGDPDSRYKFMERLKNGFEPDLNFHTPGGVSLTDPAITLTQKLNIIDQTLTAQQDRVKAILENPEFQKLHPIAKRYALASEQARHLLFIQSVIAAIDNEQNNGDPLVAQTLRAALKNYISVSPVTGTMHTGTIEKINNWLDAGGYPKFKPAPKILATVPNQPKFGIGNYDAGVLGTVSSVGTAVGQHVPPYSSIPDLQSAVLHVKSGGLLSEVPDIFLADAIKANTGPGERFLIDESIKGGYNGDGIFGVIDTASKDPVTGEYKRYIHKKAHRNAAEHINEILGSQLEHQLGMFAVGHRVAGKKTKATDKFGNKESQRPIIQEHIGNLFLGSGWTVVGSWGGVSKDEKVDPESLAQLIAANRFMNHFDRTPANVIVVRDPDGRLHIVPIDDGNAFYEFGKGQKGQGDVALPELEQQRGFIEPQGHSLDWFKVAMDKLSDEDKVIFAASLRESVDRFLSLDIDGMELEILGSYPWDEDEIAFIKDRFDILKRRRNERDWEKMLTEAYAKLGIDKQQVDEHLATKKSSKLSQFKVEEGFTSPNSTFYKLLNMPQRNLGAKFLWDADKIERQEVTILDAELSNDPFGTPDGTPAVVANLRLSGDALTVLAGIKDGENGWKVLSGPSGKLGRPLGASYKKPASGKKLGNKRRFDIFNQEDALPGGGTNFIKQLDDGTVLVVYRHPGSHAFANTLTIYKASDSPDVLSVSNIDSVVESALAEFSIDSAMPTEESLYEQGMRDLAASLFGKPGAKMSDKSLAEVEAKLATLGISSSDLELAFDQHGTPYMRLTAEARRKLIKSQNRRALKHRYSHSKLGERRAFINTIFTGHLGSTVRRFNNGMPFGGWSSNADTTYTSAKWTFWHWTKGKKDDAKLLLDDDMTAPEVKEFIQDNMGAIHNYQSITPIEFVIERPTMRFTKYDRLGDPDDWVGFAEATEESYIGSAEPMVYDSVSVAKMLHIVPDDEYDGVIGELNALGVTEVDGIPLEVLIIKQSDNPSEAFIKLREYWKDLGWI